ncbi:ShlB/FhaC/HecB family hemolysin secretion/activation protein (plasmid) [Burkholderia sp. JP2-270]|uniref:ShlB/FhaC/HecB family hemolysin secretion/activation protein n=1 Tax=Burkholderia sp. JP2-270 TaxID=2217913 RepID=UPI000DA3AFE4|nr:ShlB/FhaC/HecB family hemolysin secretion/activation protein [Burkholderia sp. JP2-270]AWV05585.1 ShlB/FhaC/HecB family hemolysin secretion/activation protein [Burkholderia sp. JP2-270]
MSRLLKSRLSIAVTLGIASLLARQSAQAQVPPVQDPAQLIIEQQRRQAQERQLEQPPASVSVPQPSATTLDIAPGTPIDEIVESGPTFRVGQIVLQTADGKPFEVPGGISRAKLDAITGLFVDHELGTHRVNVLLKRLTDTFVGAGYVTTRALLGPQNLASGVLKVTIQLGRIEAFTINGKPIHRLNTNETSAGGGWFTDAGYETAFPTDAGDPLRLSDIDQGVSQINRLRRNQAAVQILPGQNAGDSVVAINNKPGDRLYFNLGIDNYGSSATGVTRYRAGVEADNLLGLQESLNVTFLDSQDSNALVGSFAIPFGRSTFSYTIADSEYQQLIGTTALLYGRTLSHIFGWNYLVQRSAADIVSVDTTLSWRRTDRTINGADLDPQRVAVLRVGANWLHKFVMNDAQGNFTFNGGISQGLPWFGANHDEHGIARDAAHSQFTKLDAAAAITLPLPKLQGAVLVYRGALGGQYTNTALFGSEQLYLGGMDTIRGFRSGEIAGDRGIYARNELAWVNVPTWKDARIEPYVFLDAGKASLVGTPGFPTLAGIGAGLRAQWQWRKQSWSGEMLVGRALTQPAALESKATLVLGTLNWFY